MVFASVAIGIVFAIGYFAVASMTPVNSTHPVFGVPTNHYLKVVRSNDVPVFVITSTKGAKKGIVPNHKPTILVNKGELVTLHLINEDHDTHSLDIDEFNVHTGDLDYFGTKSITFIADTAGQFVFRCQHHPEMTGNIIVE